MKNLKNIFLLASFVGFVACSEEEPVIEYVTVTETVVETVVETETVEVEVLPETLTVGTDGGITKLTGDNEWSNEQTIIIRGKVVVTDGATLTVEAGTIIKAGEGTLNDATALVVARGGKIYLNGTESEPIIMTDINDNISYDSPSTNRTSMDRGKWGGLIVLGKAKISNSTPERAVEGILGIEGETWMNYGGDDNTDDSGSITYVSIRHSGISVKPDEELQGLTLGGVGNGTTIENVEIVGSDDDGVEFFGGSVNVTNLLIWNHFDDGIDIDMAYSGTINNAIVEYAADSDGAFEIDGAKVTTYEAQCTIDGLTVYGRYADEAADSDQLGRIRENIQIKILDAHYTGAKAEASKLEGFELNDGSFTDGASSKSFGSDASGSEDIIFADWYFNGTFEQATIVGKNTVNDASARDINTSFSDWATIGTSPEADQGADTSAFSWTWWASENL